MEPTKKIFYSNYLLDTSHQLKPQLLDEVIPYLTENKLEKLPTACQGKSAQNIRILAENKNVLIRIAHDKKELDNLELRITKMQSARKFTKKYNYQYLKIPKANLIGNHLIEKLLPCRNGGFFGTMYYYIQNHHLFDFAVVEFTELLMKTTLKDIVGCHKWMKSNWPNGVPRYDNILIYEYEKNGITKYRIGLIDLETFQDVPEEGNHVFKAIKNAILLFPYQYDIILNASQTDNEFNEDELKAFKVCLQDALAAIDRIYTEHLNFLDLSSNSFTQFLNSYEEKIVMIEELSQMILCCDTLYGDNYWYRVESNDINFHENVLSDGKTSNSVVIKIKLLGEDTFETLEYLKNNFFYKCLHKICKVMKKKIDYSTTKISINDRMSIRRYIFMNSSSQELFTVKRKFDLKPFTFTAKSLTVLTEEDKQDLVEIDSFFSNMIAKSQFEEGSYTLPAQGLLLKLFKKKGLIASTFFEKDTTTIFF